VGKQCVVGLHVLLAIFDRLPLHVTFFGILAHVVYLQNFSRHWPVISLLSPTFLGSFALLVIHHFVAFYYFTDRANRSLSRMHGGLGAGYRPAWDKRPKKGEEDISFGDVATYFGLCVWLLPFYLFLSLSANDNVLPSQSTFIIIDYSIR
jgi:hypothetical protein